MIDYESVIYTKIVTALRNEFPSIHLNNEERRSPASFPSVMLIERSNSSFPATMDSASTQNHAIIVYEVNVYSNKHIGRKQECKDIMNFISNMFTQLGFERLLVQPIENLNDPTIYRIVGRYQAVISADGTIYRR